MGLFDNISFGKTKMTPPSLINDPFKKNHVTSISVRFSEPFWHSDKEWEANGTIKFKNGNTSGEQDFKAKGNDAFDEVVLQMKAFMKDL